MLLLCLNQRRKVAWACVFGQRFVGLLLIGAVSGMVLQALTEKDVFSRTCLANAVSMRACFSAVCRAVSLTLCRIWRCGDNPGSAQAIHPTRADLVDQSRCAAHI